MQIVLTQNLLKIFKVPVDMFTQEMLKNYKVSENKMPFRHFINNMQIKNIEFVMLVIIELINES